MRNIDEQYSATLIYSCIFANLFNKNNNKKFYLQTLSNKVTLKGLNSELLEHLGQKQYVVKYERIKPNICFWAFIKNELVFIHKLHTQLRNRVTTYYRKRLLQKTTSRKSCVNDNRERNELSRDEMLSCKVLSYMKFVPCFIHL